MGEQSNTAPAWVIVQTAAAERTETDLRRTGYRVYLPRYRKALWPHGADRRINTSMRPVFRGLIFCQDWRGWPKQTIGGEPRLMLAPTGRAAKLVDADIDLIMRRERELQYDDIKYPAGGGKPVVRDDLVIGAEVAFERFGERVIGALDELSENGKAFVRVFFLGRETRTEINADALDMVLA